MPKRVMILATDGFEQSELTEPKARLEAAGLEVDVVSPQAGEIRGWDHTDWGEAVRVDKTLSEVEINDYDALVLPGGQMNPDNLRMNARAVAIVRAFDMAHKPIAAICHGPWLLSEAHIVKGRKVTSWPSIRTDLRNAGAEVVDEEVARDGNLITSRWPEDIPAFSDAILETMNVRVPEPA